MCKPFLPVLQDTVAHFIWEANHMATIHQHGGDQHVEDELHKSNDNLDKNTTLTIEPVSLHIPMEHDAILHPILPEAEKYLITVSQFLSATTSKHYPPPRIA